MLIVSSKPHKRKLHGSAPYFPKKGAAILQVSYFHSQKKENTRLLTSTILRNLFTVS